VPGREGRGSRARIRPRRTWDSGGFDVSEVLRGRIGAAGALCARGKTAAGSRGDSANFQDISVSGRTRATTESASRPLRKKAPTFSPPPGKITAGDRFWQESRARRCASTLLAETCATCDGTGATKGVHQYDCPECNGSGQRDAGRGCDALQSPLARAGNGTGRCAINVRGVHGGGAFRRRRTSTSGFRGCATRLAAGVAGKRKT